MAGGLRTTASGSRLARTLVAAYHGLPRDRSQGTLSVTSTLTGGARAPHDGHASFSSPLALKALLSLRHSEGAVRGAQVACMTRGCCCRDNPPSHTSAEWEIEAASLVARYYCRHCRGQTMAVKRRAVGHSAG